MEDILSSKMKSQRGRGEAADDGGSSTYKKTLAPIPNVSVPNVRPLNANARDDNKRLAEISGHPIATHPHMAPNTGSPSGKVK